MEVDFAQIRWTLLLKLKKRRIAYLNPCAGFFRDLGGRAVTAARESDLSKELVKALNEAPHYAEGTGIRLIVKAKNDLAGVRKLAAIKLANLSLAEQGQAAGGRSLGAAGF